MGTKTVIMLCFVAYRLYVKNKPIKSVNFNQFLQKGGKVHEIPVI
ncbi:hypothetical protein [Bacillus sp. MRMR6]|nr:hypothetical protein [Bacillus sp. MRMR6]